LAIVAARLTASGHPFIAPDEEPLNSNNDEWAVLVGEVCLTVFEFFLQQSWALSASPEAQASPETTIGILPAWCVVSALPLLAAEAIIPSQPMKHPAPATHRLSIVASSPRIILIGSLLIDGESNLPPITCRAPIEPNETRYENSPPTPQVALTS
jgi:hypothetical protein